MLIVDFKDENYKRVTGLWQWDYGQVLRIQGLNLPKAVEIHFSLQESGGQSVTRIGMTKDGVTDVVIPDSLLENEESLGDYDIFAFIYLTDDTSGQTEYKICMPVKARPKPEAFDKPEDGEIFREAITAVRESAERAESAEQKAAQHAEQTKADAIKTGEDRTAIAEMVDSVSGISEQVQIVKDYKEQAQTAATNALLSEQKSEQAKESAIQAQANAETAEDMAEQHVLEVAGDKSEVERLATQVRQDKTEVEQTAQGFGNTAQQAKQSINTAKTKAVEAVNATKSDAVKAVQTEGTKQTGNVTAEGEKQVQAVQVKGQEVINSIPEDFPTQMQSKLDKQQGTENAGKLLGVGTDGNVALMGGASVGEILIADYTHRGNPEFHFADFDFATGIGTTTEPHGLTKKTEVLICPNDWTILNPFNGMLSMPIEWTMVEKLSDALALIPVDNTHLKVVASKEEAIINVNLEDVSNTNVDITKFHFEKPISYVVKNLDNKINTKYIKVLSSGYCFWTGKYRYRNVSVIFESGKTGIVNYINTLGFSKYGNSPARNGIFLNEETLIDLRNNTKYYNKILSYSRRKGYSILVNDPYRLVEDVWILTQSENVKAIRAYQTYANDYAYMSNGTRIQIYALEGEYKNES
jgi:hypothetical protein|nr:MAG TPA: cell division protein [Caudoviricetes sp.]